jgi:serine phosphatase RsbU (regulator of sigma subunit)
VSEQNVPRFSWKNYIRTLLFGYGVAGIVAILTNLGRDPYIPRLLLFIAVIGFLINASIWAFVLLLRPLFRRLSDRWHLFVYALALTLGGVFGFPIGFSLSMLISYGRLPSLGAAAEPFAITVGISLIAGIGMYAYFALERQLYQSVERLRESEMAEKELELARSIQKRLLPPDHLRGAGWAIEARNVPARYVAGDFWEALSTGDQRVAIFTADVAGKGIGASLIMASIKSVLPHLLREGVVETVAAIHHKLRSELGPREFLAMTHLTFDSGTGEVEMVNAGLPDPYQITTGGTIIVRSAPGPRLPLGLSTAASYQPLTFILGKGERLVLITDGIPETSCSDGDLLGYDRFETLLRALVERDAITPEAIIREVEQFTVGRVDDDWTVVVLYRL